MQTFRAGNLNKNTTSGFTLFEMLIVVALIGCMVGLAIPAMNWGNSSGDMRTAIRRVSGAVAEARARALLKQKPLQLGIGEDTLQLYQMADGRRECIAVVRMPDGVTIDHTEISENESRTILQFLPKGVTQPVAMWLRSANEWQTVFIKPVRGIETESGRLHLSTKKYGY